jgi:hypothetical protein
MSWNITAYVASHVLQVPVHFWSLQQAVVGPWPLHWLWSLCLGVSPALHHPLILLTQSSLLILTVLTVSCLCLRYFAVSDLCSLACSLPSCFQFQFLRREGSDGAWCSLSTCVNRAPGEVTNQGLGCGLPLSWSRHGLGSVLWIQHLIQVMDSSEHRGLSTRETPCTTWWLYIVNNNTFYTWKCYVKIHEF